MNNFSPPYYSDNTTSTASNYSNNYYRPHQLRFENAQRFNQAMLQNQNVISDINNNRVMRIRNSARTQRYDSGFGQSFSQQPQQSQQPLVMNERDIKFANKLLFIFGLGTVGLFILLFKIYNYLVNVLLRKDKEKRRKVEQPFSQVLKQLEREWFPYKFSSKTKLQEESNETQLPTQFTEKQEEEIKDLVQKLKEDSKQREQQQRKQQQETQQQQKLFKKGILYLFQQYQIKPALSEESEQKI